MLFSRQFWRRKSSICQLDKNIPQAMKKQTLMKVHTTKQHCSVVLECDYSPTHEIHLFEQFFKRKVEIFYRDY
jgi:hypothetical protein